MPPDPPGIARTTRRRWDPPGRAPVFRGPRGRLPRDIEIHPIRMPDRENRLSEQSCSGLAKLTEALRVLPTGKPYALLSIPIWGIAPLMAIQK